MFEYDKAISRATYRRLFALIFALYGPTNFNLPDIR